MGVKKTKQAGMVRNKEKKKKEGRVMPIWHTKKLREKEKEESWVQIESAHAGR